LNIHLFLQELQTFVSSQLIILTLSPAWRSSATIKVQLKKDDNKDSNIYNSILMNITSIGLKKWVEVGNSGVFRPEMLLPMGLPEDVSVIAWGLSLER